MGTTTAVRIRSFEDATRFLDRSRSGYDRPAPEGANTRVVKVGDHDIALRYRLTNVVTWHADGSITLNTDGWLTQTSQRRINEYSPFTVCQRNGRWWISLTRTQHTIPANEYMAEYTFEAPDWSDLTPYIDGLHLQRDLVIGWVATNAPDKATIEREDKHNRSIKRLVNIALKKILWHNGHMDQGWANVNGIGNTRCTRCYATLSNGKDPDPETRAAHVEDHLHRLVRTGDLSADLASLIVAEHARNPESMAPSRDWVRGYFLRHLLVGSVSSKHGVAPADALVGAQPLRIGA